MDEVEQRRTDCGDDCDKRLEDEVQFVNVLTDRAKQSVGRNLLTQTVVLGLIETSPPPAFV